MQKNKLFQSAHLIILICYTLFSVLLIVETLLLSWETWAVFLMVISVGICWFVHIQQRLNDEARLWVYSVLMMVTAFFYGIHLTSTYDFALIACLLIMIYTMTGTPRFISLCQITYYLALSYDLYQYFVTGGVVDSLMVTRTILHIIVVYIAGWIARNIISKWKNVLVETDEKIENLERSTKKMNDFLANVSHEIRTPINAVIGLSSVIEKSELPTDVIDNINAISRAGHRAADQIGDILDFTEIDMKTLSVNEEHYMPGSLVNDILNQLSFKDNNGFDLVLDMDSSMPSELFGDVTKIKKIIVHLIDNGFKYTKAGGVYVRLYPIRRSYGINLCIEIADTGVGMTEEQTERSFEDFYQSDSGRSRSAGGLGLGLPIVSGFVRAMGGVMSVESEPGEGTFIRVSVPQKVENDTPCMSVNKDIKYTVGVFIGFISTVHPKVREFYSDMMNHLVDGLGVPFYRVSSVYELEELVDSMHLTHLFVGRGEYLENKALIDELAEKIEVAIVEDEKHGDKISKRIAVLPRPFYGAQIVNFLNNPKAGQKIDAGERMMTPGLRALVVDDEPMNLLVARGIFETYGMIVDTAHSGQKSIEMCIEHDYDIVFMDHMMPGMDGVEAMKRIRAVCDKNSKEIIIIALTANAISSAKEMFLREGFDGFVPKPIETLDLERVLKHVLPKSLITYETEDVIKAITSANSEKSKKDKAKKNEEKAKETHTKSSVAIEPMPSFEIINFDGEEETITESAEPGSPDLLGLKKIGVDADAGMKYCLNDSNLYNEILKEYVSSSRSKTAELEKFVEDGNIGDYQIKVHAIKSTSKMIGAMKVSEQARMLEEAAKTGDIEKIRNDNPEFLTDYKDLMDKIAGVTGFSDADKPAEEEGSNSDVSEQSDENDEVLEFSPDSDDILEFSPEGGDEA